MKKNTSRRLICLWKWDFKHCSLASDLLAMLSGLAPCFPRWCSPWQSHGKPRERDTSPAAAAKGVGVRGQGVGPVRLELLAGARQGAVAAAGQETRLHSSRVSQQISSHTFHGRCGPPTELHDGNVFRRITLGVGSLEFISYCWFWTHH